MRRNYISPEFDYKKVYGTFNTKSESSFFGTSLLEIEDEISIDNQGIVYYQNINNEQIDISVEGSLSPTIYSTSDDKNSNHTIKIDESQTEFQKNSNTKYIIEINLRSILSNFLFATLKEHRTFEGVKNEMTFSGDINTSINNYIRDNIYSKYKLDKIEMYIKYNSLRDQSILRFKNNWNDQIGTSEYILNRFQTETEFDYSKVIISFNQEKSSSEYSFDYYYKLYWKKI